MINKRIDNITIDDLQELIDNAVSESKTLDYKSTLCINTDAEKKEFLADITSFANCIGGDLIIGIEEDSTEKIPIAIRGFSYKNEDEIIRQIESLIRDSVEPQLLNIQFKFVTVSDNNSVLIIRIPQSISAPHRTMYKNSGKFYTRNNKGKYLMDISELKLAFNGSMILEEKIQNYKLNRYSDFISKKYQYFSNADEPFLIVHYIPISAFTDSSNKYSVQTIRQSISQSKSDVFGNNNFSVITFDGLAISKTSYDDSCGKYYYNGIVEKATTKWFEKNFELSGIKPAVIANNIFCNDLFSELVDDFNKVKKYYNLLGINAPILISISILNATDYTIISRREFQHILGKIDRDILCLEDIYVDNLNNETENILRPAFDSIWNACGFERCPAYDENGIYKGFE